MAEGLPADWLQRAARPLKYAGIVAYKITKVYDDGVEETEIFPEEDYMIVDTRARERERNVLLRHNDLVRGDNEAQKARWAEEQERRDRALNCPG